MAHSPKNATLSIPNAAERHNVSVSVIRRLIAKGELRAYRLGSRIIRIDPADLDKAFRPVNPVTFAKVSGGDCE